MARDALTRQQIVGAAVGLLDAEGIEGLSMRQLGRRLGSAATAIYWHVQGKEDLVVLAADSVWGEIELPDPAAVGWRPAATAMALGLHAMVVRHPWLVTAMSTHLVYGPGKARHDDSCLAVYEAAGFTGRDADRAAATVFTYVLGTAMSATAGTAWRNRLRRRGGDEDAQLRDVVDRVNAVAAPFPRLRARSEAWTEVDGEASDLEFGLRAVLDGLQVQLTDRS